jgi:hypothetical protein
MVLNEYEQAAAKTNSMPKTVLLDLIILGPRINKTPVIPSIKPSNL